MAKIVLGIGIIAIISPNLIWNLKGQLVWGILNQKDLKLSISFHPLICLSDILALWKKNKKQQQKNKPKTPYSLVPSVLKGWILDILVYISKEGIIDLCWEPFFFFFKWHLKLFIKLCLFPFSYKYGQLQYSNKFKSYDLKSVNLLLVLLSGGRTGGGVGVCGFLVFFPPQT